MKYFCLGASLILPWLAGFLWLSALEQRFNRYASSGTCRVGYGLFLGYGGLQGLVLGYSQITGSIDFWPIFFMLALFTALGGGLWLTTRTTTALPPVAATNKQHSEFFTALFWLLIAWSGLHLLFVAIEILHRPVFAWDAWLNWIYRAKAWYYLGDIVPLDHPTQWLQGTGEVPYAVAGNHYPTFAPVMALWAATALGHWSGTLINLPTLLCGIALALGMYGQCRESGLPKWTSALGAYLLLSIPLVGTHLALAGKSDIWMTGFTGLGFVALLGGCIRNNHWQVLLGLALVAMGIAVKMEGSVWFLAALLTLALIKRPRWSLGTIAVAAIIAGLGWLAGVTYLELPVSGALGFHEGRVHIPLLGSYGLQSFDLLDDYWANFFEGGTWHLLWTVIVISAASLWLLPAGILRRTIASFYAVTVVAQLFIFEGTEAGQWAEDWTAINRLPLHFAPPLIFLLLLQASALLPASLPRATSRAVWRAPALGLAITLAGTFIYLLLAYPGSGGATQSFAGQDMRIVVGKGRLVGGAGIVDEYQNNIAVLSSGKLQLEAEQFDLLRLDTRGENEKHTTFFWRNGPRDEDLHSTQVEHRGVTYLSLDELPQWGGSVSEIGLIFYADNGRSAAFHSLQILPHSVASHLEKLARDWSETSLWTLQSVNFLPAGATNSTVPLPLLAAAWVIVTLVLMQIFARHSPQVPGSLLICALLAWALLDARWSANSLLQAADTIADYPLATATHMEFGDDAYTQKLVDRARPDIEEQGTRTLIMAEEPNMKFQLLRAKYHALPAATVVHAGPVKSAPVQKADYLLVLRQRYADASNAPAEPKAYARAIKKRTGLEARTLWDSEEAFLLKIEQDPEHSPPRTDHKE